MERLLEDESEKLARSWMQHDAGKLRDYLVSSVEDPRINLQSVFSRHFLLQALAGGRFDLLMEQECRFAAAPIERLKRDYRYHFILKSASRQKLNVVLRAMLAQAAQEDIPRTNVIVDVDALWLM